MMKRAALWIIAAALVAAFVFGARADDHSYLHAQGHNDYRNWSSLKIQNCCNNQDCRGLEPDEWHDTPSLAVKIDGEWCPVLPEHFLTRGKSPDWQRAHACIRPKLPGTNAPPCERLLCFTGVPNG